MSNADEMHSSPLVSFLDGVLEYRWLFADWSAKSG
jgi:hypothetical protein